MSPAGTGYASVFSALTRFILSGLHPREPAAACRVRDDVCVRFSVSWFAVNESRLPRWARELARQIEHGGEQAPPETLGLISSLREVLLFARGVLAGRIAESREDRSSLRDDLARAMDGLGPQLRSEAAAELKQVRTELARLPPLLSEPDGALTAVGLVEAALEALADERLLGAAWDDLRSAYEQGEDAGVCELRTKVLAELVELRGADWRSASKTVGRVLFDDRLVLSELGAIDLGQSPPADPEEFNEPAGLPFEERFELARRTLTEKLPLGNVVVWVCFANAWVSSVYLKLGDVEFFGHQMWSEGAVQTFAGQEPMREFEEPARWHFEHLPEEPFALVRVPLGDHPLMGAAERGRAIARDLVRAARPHSEWRLVDGAAVFVDGDDGQRGWIGPSISDRPIRPTERLSPRFEPTGFELADLGDDVVSRIVAGDAAIHDALRDIEWAETVSDIEDVPQRLALSTRLVERRLPTPAGDHWSAQVKRYLGGWWAEQQARDLIVDAAHAGVDLLDSVMSSDNANSGWRQKLMCDRGAAGEQTHLGETLRLAGQLADDMPAGSLQRRVVEELAQHAASSAAWAAFLERKQQVFDVLLARLVRQRNAVLHGADTEPAVIESVVWFGLSLQAYVMHTQFSAAAGGESLLTALERNRIRIERIHQRLADGERPEAAMFDGTRD